MATITNTVTAPVSHGDNMHLVTWAAMGIADTGDAIELYGATHRSVQVDGTFGGATVVIEGSNDGTTYYTLRDPQGNALSFTTANLKAILETTRWIRPKTSGGSGTVIAVEIFFRRDK